MGEVEDVGERAEARRDDDAGRKNVKLRRFVDENLDKISLALSDGGTTHAKHSTPRSLASCWVMGKVSPSLLPSRPSALWNIYQAQQRG